MPRKRIFIIARVRLIGTAQEKAAVLSFVLEGVHPHDIGTVLDHEGIAVRTGHHCAQPVMAVFFWRTSDRPRFRFALYSTEEEVDCLDERGSVRFRRIFA